MMPFREAVKGIFVPISGIVENKVYPCMSLLRAGNSDHAVWEVRVGCWSGFEG